MDSANRVANLFAAWLESCSLVTCEARASRSASIFLMYPRMALRSACLCWASAVRPSQSSTLLNLVVVFCCDSSAETCIPPHART